MCRDSFSVTLVIKFVQQIAEANHFDGVRQQVLSRVPAVPRGGAINLDTPDPLRPVGTRYHGDLTRTTTMYACSTISRYIYHSPVTYPGADGQEGRRQDNTDKSGEEHFPDPSPDTTLPVAGLSQVNMLPQMPRSEVSVASEPTAQDIETNTNSIRRCYGRHASPAPHIDRFERAAGVLGRELRRE